MLRAHLLPRTRALAVVVLLGAVVTAHAPSYIQIRPGDTLSELALRHGTSVAALRALNDLRGNGTIYAGRRLQISGGSDGGAAGAGGGTQGSYTVRPGDNLSTLARRFGTTVAAIRRGNDLANRDHIVIGRRLTIPGAGGSAAGAPAASSRTSSRVSQSPAANRAHLRSVSHPSKARVRRMVAATARRYGVSPSLAVSVAYHESGFQQRVVSGVNAIGVMQVLPSTGDVLGQQHGMQLDLLNAQDNITAGVLLLRQLLRSTGSERMALAGYYQGLGSISRKGLLPQTHDYIRSIGYLRERFANG